MHMTGISWRKKIIRIDTNVYGVASKQTSSSIVGKTECRQFFNYSSKQTFNNFENIIEYAQSIRIIQFNDTEWKLSTCNCVEWKKLFKCNHVIAVAYLNKKLD